jgi:thiol-disulfide isomerase/thioredoxin
VTSSHESGPGRLALTVAGFAAAVFVAVELLTAAPRLHADDMRSYAGTEPAPEFPSDLDWINTSGKRLSLAQLRGKVVLLDFWTFGCVNCMHVIPDLKKLEATYPRELVVIGVHTAKFANEGRTEAIRSVVQRYELEHPVLNDRDYDVWRSYGVNAWPTFALIDPEGRLIGTLAGEGHYEVLDKVIAKVIEQFDAQGKINRTPLGLTPDALPSSALRFPGKVLADAAGGRLFIADSNHNRIVVATLDGRVTAVIGSGKPELRDGAYAEAAFSQPQGMTLADARTLYIADTSNNALRRVDLEAKRVETVAGTGEQVYLSQSSAPARGTGLNTPWDVLWHDGLVYIAMAGQHQIWTYDPKADLIREFAGSRREELRDGARLTGGLNQPSGLATDGESLYVADSEASAIRRIGLGPDGKLSTIVGTGLFDFGDKDGFGDNVRLQHPLHVSYADGILYVADTYNGKIKRVDPKQRTSRSFIGGKGELNEPGGISIAGDTIYIADTNDHVVKVASLGTGKLEELPLADPDSLLHAAGAASSRDGH